MPVKQAKNGGWICRVDRSGIPRISKTFALKSEAEIFERQYLASHKQKQLENLDKRTLRELVEAWFIYHGINLSDCEKRKRILFAMCKDLGNPVASQLTAEDIVNYRYQRTRGQNAITAKTFNNHHGYLNAVYNKLSKLQVIDYNNPIKSVDFIKIHERQLSFLSGNQIDELLDAIVSGCINQSTWYVTQICLRTGARWSEAEQLKAKQVKSGLITYEFTKSKKTRSVPLDDVFYKQLSKFIGNKNPDDRLFTNCIGAFRRAVDRTEIQLPRGQNTHILRHTFASHFMMNGGNILTLQKILGHADITQTMRYAHLSPDHLRDAIAFNPMAKQLR